MRKSILFSTALMAGLAFSAQAAVTAETLSGILTLATPGSLNPDSESTSGYGMYKTEWLVNDADLSVNKSNANATATLKRDGEVLYTIAASDSKVYFEEPMVWGEFVIDGDFAVTWADPGAADVTATGEYTVVFSEGFFSYKGEESEEYVIAFNYTGSQQGGGDDDFTYTISPAAETTVSSLHNILVTIDNAEYIMYVGSVGKLVSEDGSLELVADYPFVTGSTLDFQFGNDDTQWVAGKYTFTIEPNAINIGNEFWDYAEGTGNFKGLTATFTLEPEVIPAITEAFTRSLPDSETVTPDNSSANGMAIVKFVIADENIALGEDPDWIGMNYAPANGESQYLTAINPANSQQCYFSGDDNLGVGGDDNFGVGGDDDFGIGGDDNFGVGGDDDFGIGGDDGDFAVGGDDDFGIGGDDGDFAVGGDDDFAVAFSDEATTERELTLVFATEEEWGEEIAQFKQNGTYEINIPSGVFTYKGQAMPAATFTYVYNDGESAVIEISAPAESFDVYSIQGVALLKNASASAVAELPAGLYIVNGKKVVIR